MKIKELLWGLLMTGVTLLIFAFMCWLVKWLCEDMGRYILGMGILIYMVYNCFKQEFGG